ASASPRPRPGLPGCVPRSDASAASGAAAKRVPVDTGITQSTACVERSPVDAHCREKRCGYGGSAATGRYGGAGARTPPFTETGLGLDRGRAAGSGRALCAAGDAAGGDRAAGEAVELVFGTRL